MAAAWQPYPNFRYYLSNGNPAVGYKVFFYEAGTSTKKNTWTDISKGTANINPIVLDANGQNPSGGIILDGSYKIVIAPDNDTDPPASPVETFDNVSSDVTPSLSGNYNLAINGSFEDDTNGDGVPDSWVVAALSSGSIALDSTSQAHGLNSLSFTSGGSGGGTATSEAYLEVQAGGVYNGVLNIISSSATTHNLMEVYWYTAAKVYISKSSVYDNSTTNPLTWTQYTGQVTAPATAYYAKIVLTGVAADSTTIVTGTKTRFDNIELLSDLLIEIGITATKDELNILDGATVTTAELNILDGATVTTAELNILDGATITVAELNTLDASAMAISNFVYSNATYVMDYTSAPTGLAWEAYDGLGYQSFGPTGSGATVIWTAMDGLPSDTKWIDVQFYYSAIVNPNSQPVGVYSIQLFARKTGASYSSSTVNAVLYDSVVPPDATTATVLYGISKARIPVDSSIRFDLSVGITIPASYITALTESAVIIGFGR